MVLQQELHRACISEVESLAKLGFNPHEQFSSLDNFSRQIEAYSLHVIEDRPVSNAYSYFIDNGEIYIDQEKRQTLFIDPEERGGLSTIGTMEAVRQAMLYPEQIIFLYSPPGIVTFERGTKYDKVKPYPDGQLYLLVGRNNNQVDAIAISVSKEHEQQVLATFLGRENMAHGGFDDEIEKIRYFLTNPVITNYDIDSFLAHLDKVSHSNDFVAYENIHNEEFYLSDIFFDLHRGWAKEIKPKINIDYQESFEMIEKGYVSEAYLSQLQHYFSIYGENGQMPLGGSCGGNNSRVEHDPLSTNYRLSTLSIQDIFDRKNKEDSDEYGSLKFQCPVCNGEHIRPRHKLLECCPVKRDENGKEIPIPKC